MKKINPETFWALTSFVIQMIMCLFICGIVVGVAGLLQHIVSHTTGWSPVPGDLSIITVLFAILVTAAACLVTWIAIIVLGLVVAGIQYLVALCRHEIDDR